jgi:hypothetical protein
MSLTPSPTACRWETFESHHSWEHGKPLQPFVRSLRIVVSGSIRHVPFYSRPLLPTAALGGCPVACPLPLRLPKRNHAVVVVAFAVGYTRLGGVATRLLRFDRLQAYHSCYGLRAARYTLRGGA